LTSGHRMIMTTVHPVNTTQPIGRGVRIGFRHLGDVLIPAIESLEDE